MKPPLVLIADSGSTKTAWCLLSAKSKKPIHTQGISPYFLSAEQITEVLKKELLPSMPAGRGDIAEVHFYGTGLADPQNARLLKKILKGLFPGSSVHVTHDLMGAARALCGHAGGIACILGTGSGACYFNGKKITKSSPGLGFILGDEGSGALLGKKVLQYYLYHTFDETLYALFEQKYHTGRDAILEQVYKKPYPNRYLASYSYFLSENRGHFMVENILEDGLNEFFSRHVVSYTESRNHPVHFTGGAAWAYRDIIRALCGSYQLTPGNIIKAPIDGLIRYHTEELEGR
jgi:N-acetylglucosamine kinase-like BadF-type ATPase